jgi:hypothetical protein
MPDEKQERGLLRAYICMGIEFPSSVSPSGRIRQLIVAGEKEFSEIAIRREPFHPTTK